MRVLCVLCVLCVLRVLCVLCVFVSAFGAVVSCGRSVRCFAHTAAPFPLPVLPSLGLRSAVASLVLCQDLANFLLLRGPYAWFGYAWIGCSQSYIRPPQMDWVRVRVFLCDCLVAVHMPWVLWGVFSTV